MFPREHQILTSTLLAEGQGSADCRQVDIPLSHFARFSPSRDTALTLFRLHWQSVSHRRASLPINRKSGCDSKDRTSLASPPRPTRARSHKTPASDSPAATDPNAMGQKLPLIFAAEAVGCTPWLVPSLDIKNLKLCFVYMWYSQQQDFPRRHLPQGLPNIAISVTLLLSALYHFSAS